MPAPVSRRLLVCCAALLTCATPGWAAPATVATQLVALYEQAKHGTRADAPLAGTVQFGSIVSALSQLVPSSTMGSAYSGVHTSEGRLMAGL